MKASQSLPVKYSPFNFNDSAVDEEAAQKNSFMLSLGLYFTTY